MTSVGTKRYKMALPARTETEPFFQFEGSLSRTSRNWTGSYFPPPNEIEEEADGTAILPNVPARFKLDDHRIKYFVGQWEQKEQGKLHYQFTVVYTTPVRQNQAREILGHWHGYLDICRSLESAITYCTKPEGRLGAIYEHGELGLGKGKSTATAGMLQDVLDGMPIGQVMEMYPGLFARNVNAVFKMASHADLKRGRYLDEMPEVYIYYGVTGSGKSYKAYHENPNAYRKLGSAKWWDGYEDQECVILEEFNPDDKNTPELTDLLKLFDRYPYRGEIKGGTVQIMAKKFIITTNLDPTRWWTGHIQQRAFHRRVTNILVFPEAYTEGTCKYITTAFPDPH